ncbi:BTB/POZ domain-containing protein 6-B-like isoform X2 [Paramacrobiotus metropolitanus]|nr:BTB/POZ domain-containing protein 6-B-like isoform X2 [Paramacrobiotus metropolitanus]
MFSNGSSSGAAKHRGAVSKIINCIENSLVCPDMSDVQFAVGRDYGEEKHFSAHKIILSVRSDVFHQMFYGTLPEKCTAPIDIPDILPDAFANMLSYMYTDAVECLNEDNAFHTLGCADKYDMPLLVELCVAFILNQLNTDNCLANLESAMFWGTPKIVENCLRLVDASAEKALQSKEFLELGQDSLIAILKRDTFYAEEDKIYAAIEKWAVHACARNSLVPSPANGRQMLGAALYLIRFPLLTDNQLRNGPAETGLLLLNELSYLQRRLHHTLTADLLPLPFPVEPRRDDARSEGTINYTVPNVKNLPTTAIYSTSICVRFLPWRIRVERLTSGASPTLGFFLQSPADSAATSWTCQVTADLRLLPHNPATPPIEHKLSHLFHNHEIGYGFPSFVTMEALLDPAKGYVNPTNSSLQLQVRLSADIPNGI